MYLDHFTIRTSDPAATRAFLLGVFDELVERPRPAAIQRRIPGHWLFADGKPIVHIIADRNSRAHGQRDHIDHVGIRLEGYGAFRDRLDALGVQYSMMDLPELMERRIFFRSPDGALIETIFADPTPYTAS